MCVIKLFLYLITICNYENEKGCFFLFIFFHLLYFLLIFLYNYQKMKDLIVVYSFQKVQMIRYISLNFFMLNFLKDYFHLIYYHLEFNDLYYL